VAAIGDRVRPQSVRTSRGVPRGSHVGTRVGTTSEAGRATQRRVWVMSRNTWNATADRPTTLSLPRPRDGGGPVGRPRDASLAADSASAASVGPVDDRDADTTLVARVRSGDVVAFEGIVHRYMRPAFSIAYHVLQHREDAEDVVQQAFMTALTRLDTYDSTRPFGPWFGRLVLNHARNALRVRQRLAHRWTEPAETIPAPMSRSPDRAAEAAETCEHVRAALAILPERQRLAVQFIDIEGYSPAEVACIMDVSPVTVRWHLMAARRKLRRLLAPLIDTGRTMLDDAGYRSASAVRPVHTRTTPSVGSREDGNAAPR
jgi:RNA polymerase sigma-70 factor, ECF subfamily